MLVNCQLKADYGVRRSLWQHRKCSQRAGKAGECKAGGTGERKARTVQAEDRQH